MVRLKSIRKVFSKDKAISTTYKYVQHRVDDCLYLNMKLIKPVNSLALFKANII